MDLQTYKQNFPEGASVPQEIQDLLNFQNGARDWYSGHFELTEWPFGQAHWFAGDRLAAEQFIVLGMESDGSLYALWMYPGRTTNDAPVVFLGSEGVDSSLIAKDLVEFLSLLAVGAEDLGFAVSWREVKEAENPAARLSEFRGWLKGKFGSGAPENPTERIDAARREHPDFAAWFAEWQARRA